MSVPPSRFVRKALQLSGMLAPPRYSRPYAILMVYCIVTTAYCCGGSLAYFFIMDGPTTEKLQCIQIALTILSGLMKLLNACLNQNKLDTLLLNYDMLWDQFYEEPLNRNIMDKSAKRCRFLRKIYICFVLWVPTSNVILAIFFYLVMGADQLPLQLYMPFDNKKYFIPIEIAQMSLVISPLMANSSSFLLYLTASEQVVTYIRVIRRKLREEKISKQTIVEHQNIIKLMNKTNDLFSWLLYFETTAISVECSCSAYTLYKIHIKEGKRESILINLVNFIFCFFIPYVICYCGGKITIESNLMFRDTYNGMWYEEDLKSKKALRMLMLGSSKGLTLHFKNIAVFGMELFRSIINVTFNVFNAILWLERADQHH